MTNNARPNVTITRNLLTTPPPAPESVEALQLKLVAETKAYQKRTRGCEGSTLRFIADALGISELEAQRLYRGDTFNTPRKVTLTVEMEFDHLPNNSDIIRPTREHIQFYANDHLRRLLGVQFGGSASSVKSVNVVVENTDEDKARILKAQEAAKVKKAPAKKAPAKAPAKAVAKKAPVKKAPVSG
jgi:hypothetical protein